MKTRAIVLHTIHYNDESIIANLLTADQGCVGMMVRISRSKRAAVKHSLFQPLMILDIEWNHKPKASLQRPQMVQAVYPFTSLPFSPTKMGIGLFVAEVLYHAVKNEPDTHAIFEYTMRSIEWFDMCEDGFANFHLVFLLHLTHFLGFMPNAYEARPGYYFDLRGACFTRQQPPHPDFLSPTDASLVPKILRMRYSNMRFFHFSGAERSRLLRHIETFYRLHIAGFPELKSLDVLREVWSS